MLKPSSLSWPRPTHLQASVLSAISDYVALTKPPIILLLLITALGGMFLAAQGTPPVSITLLLLLGGAAAAGGASAINHYLDRDIDEPHEFGLGDALFRHDGSPHVRAAHLWDLAQYLRLCPAGLPRINMLTALLTLGGTLFYVFVYTWLLKRSTPQNIVIGGRRRC